jgi:hypothetical protein
MKKTALALVFSLLAALGYASDEFIHDSDLMRVLLWPPFPQTEDAHLKFDLITKAAYLAIDLFNGSNPQYLDELAQAGVKNLPNFQEINFTAGSEHQRYTHRGWDWLTYPQNIRGYNFQEIWGKRKALLLNTLDYIFKFRDAEAAKRNSLGAVIYYTHVLGDHIGDSNRTYMDRLPISPRPDYRFNRSGENPNNPTIYTELLYHLPRLFRGQTDSSYYRMLVLSLSRNQSRVFSTGTTISDEEYAELQNFARDTLNILTQYIPQLLKNEDFFKRAFP